MTKLEKAKEIIKEHLEDATCGIFDSRNLVGDWMTNIYNNNGLAIDICYNYSYFEVFGLSKDDFIKLERYYKSLVEEFDKKLFNK